MQALIDELYESWANGNRKHVVDTVCDWTGAKAVLAGMLLDRAMGYDDRMILNRMLRERFNEGES